MHTTYFLQIKRLEAGEGGGSTVLSSGYGGTGRASSAGGNLGGSVAGGSTLAGGGGSSSSVLDVDRRAEEDLAAMSNDRRQIVEALTEERAGYDIAMCFSPVPRSHLLSFAC